MRLNMIPFVGLRAERVAGAPSMDAVNRTADRQAADEGGAPGGTRRARLRLSRPHGRGASRGALAPDPGAGAALLLLPRGGRGLLPPRPRPPPSAPASLRRADQASLRRPRRGADRRRHHHGAAGKRRRLADPDAPALPGVPLP